MAKNWWEESTLESAAPKNELADEWWSGAKLENAPQRTWGEAIKDTGAQLAEGVNTTLGAIPSVVAPQSKAAGFFRDNAQYWRDQQSDVLKGRIAASDQRIQEAGKDGVLSQIGTAASEYWNDPAQAARLVATNLPSMAATLGTSAAAGLAAKGVAAARGLDAANKAALAAKYGTTTAAATNAALNAGGARGEAFEDVQKAAIAQGITPEQAEQAGVSGSIMPGVVGGVAGAISGKIGLEKALLGQATTGAAMRKAAGAFGAELAGEQIEELAPKVATNYQVGRIDPGRTLTDDLGRTMVETAIGSGPGAVVAGGASAMRTGETPPPPGAGEPTTSPGAADPDAPTRAPVPPPVAGPTLALAGPGRGVIKVAGDGTARTPAYQAPGYVGDVTDVEPRAVNPVREQVAAAAERGGALSSAALTAIDTGLSDAMQPTPEQAPPEISLEEADARDRAAYEQFFAGFDADPVVSRYFENDDDIPDFDAASNASEEDFLRTLGATDEDIQDAIATSSQSAIPQSSVASNAGPQAYEPAGPREGAGEGAASQTGQVNAGAIQQAAPDAPVPGVGGPVGADGAGSAATAVSGASGPGGAGTGAATGSSAGATEVGSARAGGRGDNNQALNAPTNLRDALERVRQQKQEAANAQAAQAPVPAAAPVPGPAAATAVEAAGLNRPKSARKAAEFDARKAAEIEAGALGAQEAEAAGVPTQVTWPAHRKWVYSQAPRMTLREFQLALKGRHGMAGPEIEAYYKSSNGGAEVSAAKITTEGAANVPHASQAQQASAQPAQAGAAQAGQPAAVAPNAAPQQTLTWATMPTVERQQAAQTAGLNKPQTAKALATNSIEEMPAAIADKLAPVLSSAAGSQAQPERAQDVALTNEGELANAAEQQKAAQARFGRDNVPLSEGGKPFKTRKAAGDAKKLQPMMRVVTVPGGYALAEKTPAQLAAEERASRRLRNPNTSARGEPIPAHAFIAAAGGLNRVAASDMGVDGNPRIGNRTLFAGQGRGLSMDQATQMLIQDGYLSEGATINDALSLIKTSLTRPQYNADGIERIAQAEADAQFEDYLAAQEEAAVENDEFDPFGPAPTVLDGFSDDMLESSGYDAATDAIKAEVRALLEMANAQGIDTESIILEAHEQTRNATEQDYYEAAKSAIEAAIAGSNRDRGTPAGSEGQGPGAAAASAEEQGLNRPAALTSKAPAATENVAPAVSTTVDMPPTRQQESSPFARFATGRYRIAIRDEGNGPYAEVVAIQRGSGVEVEMRMPGEALDHPAFSQLNARAQALFETPTAGMFDAEPPALELAAQTPAEAEAQQDAQEQAAKAEAAANRAEDAAAKAEDERKRIAQASVRAADRFELGQDPMDSLTGQGGLMFSRTGAKSPNAQQPTTRAWYDRFVSLLPASYRNDPHRREPFPAEDWNVQRASEVRSKVEALNKQLRGADDRKGYGPVSVDGLGNLQVDARDVSAEDLTGDIMALANELGAGIAATNVRSADARALQNSGFVSESSLAAIADRLMQRPFASSTNNYAKDSAPGAVMTYKPRGFPAALFARDVVQNNATPARPTDSNARLVAAQMLVDGLMENWTRAPEIIVARNMQDPQVPQAVRDYDQTLKSQGATGEPRGFIYKGKVYLLSDQLKGPQQIAEVLFHEVLGHYGLRGAFGDGLTPILQQIGTMRRADVVAKAREYGLFDKDALGVDPEQASNRQIWDAMTAQQRLEAAEEVLAEMAQTQPNIGFVQRAIAAIRNWLRSNVPGFKNLRLTDADIVQKYLLPARRYVTRSKETGAQSLERAMGAFSRTPGDQTQTENFRRWFKDSKAVDADGRPGRDTNAGMATNEVVGKNQGGRSADDISPGASFDAQAAFEKHGGTGDIDESTDITAKSQAFADMAEAEGYTVIGRGDKYVTIKKSFGQDADGYAKTAIIKVRISDHSNVNRGNHFGETDINIAPDDGYSRDTFADALRKIQSAYVNDDLDTVIPSEPTASGLSDAANPDIRFSRTASPSQPAAWDAPVQTGFDDVIYKLQDKNIDLKRVVEAITKATGKVADSINAYLKEELFHKRAAKRVADFGDRELKPLMNQMRLAGLSMEDVEEYLHARHAKEANAVIAERNPDNPGLQDGGSGMTNAAADNYFAKLDPTQRRKLEAVAKSVDAIIEGTRKLYVDYGLEDQAVVDGWANMYQHYIPLMREDKDGGMGIGQGFSVKGKETKGRTGSTRKVVDILANVAMQREKLIVRGEKNIVAQALVGLAQANPNPDFWEVRSQAPTERVFDPKTGVVVDRPDPLFKSRENVAVAKVKDANGKVTEQMVVFNEDNPRAVRMAAAMKNLDAGNLEGLLGMSAKITRYFSAINTQYNPVFGVVNLVRDVQGAMVNLAATPLAGQQGKIAKDTVSALAGIYSDIRKTRKGGQATSKWAQLWEQMQDDGGTTGYRDLFKTSADRAENLKSILNPEGWMDSKLGRFFTADGRLKVPVGMAKKGAGFIFDWLSDYNEAMENGVRLAAYKAALDKGMSREQAASLAKNLTVNFNRKGQAGQQAGAVYAFFNAAMQGTARIGQTLFDMDGGDISTLRLSKTGKAVVYGGVTLGVMQALALSAAGFDDDDPPEFVRERSLIIPTGGKTYVSIPMPLGLHVIPGIGRHATEFALSGFDKPAKRALSVIGMFADAFNPIGNAGLSMQTLAPTALDPLVALTENKDWTGKPIARMSFNKALPGHTQWKDTATWYSKMVAEAINWVSGGNEYVAGALSPTPDQIDYLIAQLGGGVAREAAKVQQTVSSTLSGEELPTYKIPLLGRFAGNAASQASQGTAFYANLDRLNALETEIKGLRKDGRFDEAAKLVRENPQATMIAMANRSERDVQKLRREKRELIAKDASREEVRAKEEQITAVMTRLNEAAERRKAQAAR